MRRAKQNKKKHAVFTLWESQNFGRFEGRKVRTEGRGSYQGTAAQAPRQILKLVRKFGMRFMCFLHGHLSVVRALAIRSVIFTGNK